MAKRFQAYEHRCEWCRAAFRSSRPDSRTCSSRCRQRWHAFVKQFGYAPRSIPGDVTYQVAADQEIVRLIRKERERIKREDDWFATGSAGAKS